MLPYSLLRGLDWILMHNGILTILSIFLVSGKNLAASLEIYLTRYVECVVLLKRYGGTLQIGYMAHGFDLHKLSRLSDGSYPISEQCCCLVVHLGPDDY